MKLSKTLQSFVERSSEADSYWVEEAKLGFSVSLERQRRFAGMTYAAIAKKIGTSAAYITKIFRGDTNVTIESMVKLARATGGQLEVNVVNSVVAAPVWHFPKAQSAPQVTEQSAIVIEFFAANHDRFKDQIAA